jgi:hypothetical protein
LPYVGIEIGTRMTCIRLANGRLFRPRSYRADRGTSHYAAFMREDMARYEQAVRTLSLQQPK